MKKSLRLKVYLKCNGHCSYCGCSLLLSNYQVDHIIPKAFFKSKDFITRLEINSFANLTPSCASCNLFKKDLSIEDFRLKIDRIPAFLQSYYHYYRVGLRYQKHFINPAPTIFYFEQIDSNRYQ